MPGVPGTGFRSTMTLQLLAKLCIFFITLKGCMYIYIYNCTKSRKVVTSRDIKGEILIKVLRVVKKHVQ